MRYQTIDLNIKNDIATITLNRPEVLNALNNRMANELLDVMREVEGSNTVRVIVVTGAGRAFTTGKDLRETIFAPEEEKVPLQWPEDACRLFRSINKPIIASINGIALGFGFGLCLACDIRIAAQRARIGMGFLSVGQTPGFGTTYFLPRLVGLGKACELAFTNRIVDAIEAERIGLVNKVVADAELEAATYELARSLAESPPFALQLTKQAIYQGIETILTSQLQFETVAQIRCSATVEHTEAMKRILEKRKSNHT